MTKAVIDVLEAIEIDENEGKGPRRQVHRSQHSLEAILETQSVRQTRETVRTRSQPQILFPQMAIGYILEDTDYRHGLSIVHFKLAS